MKKELPEIRESVATLRQRLRTERQGRRRVRLQVLYLLKSGQAQTRQEVASLVAVHRHTVGRWLETYDRAGLEAMLTTKTHSNRQPILASGVRQALAKKLHHAHGFASYGEVQQWLHRRHGVQVRYKTLHRLVRYQLRAKLKVPRPSHVKKTLQQPTSFS
jgi:transposase